MGGAAMKYKILFSNLPPSDADVVHAMREVERRSGVQPESIEFVRDLKVPLDQLILRPKEDTEEWR